MRAYASIRVVQSASFRVLPPLYVMAATEKARHGRHRSIELSKKVEIIKAVECKAKSKSKNLWPYTANEHQGTSSNTWLPRVYV